MMIKNIQHRTYNIAFGTLLFLTLFFVLCSLFSFALAQTEDATTSVREKVRQTIENLTKKPRAVIGNLDNVSDSTLQVKNLQGKISLVAVNDKTVYIKYVKGSKTNANSLTSSSIKFEDLTIGDFTVSLGYKNSNDTLDAARVLSFAKAPFVEKKILFVEVDTINKNSIAVTDSKTNDSWTIDATNSTLTQKITGKLQNVKVSDINEGDTLIVIGIVNDKKPNTLIATRIHIFAGSASSVSKASPTPTSSAKPKATPSPSPKATVKPTATPAL